MNYLLSGSFAYDTILLFHGKLETHILPESISRLNVSFLIDSTKDEFGGTYITHKNKFLDGFYIVKLQKK